MVDLEPLFGNRIISASHDSPYLVRAASVVKQHRMMNIAFRLKPNYEASKNVARFSMRFSY